jgi:PAS domain S-box-containing protein
MLLCKLWRPAAAGKERKTTPAYRATAQQRGLTVNDQLQQFQVMFENLPYGAFFRNADGLFCDVNQAALEMLGISREDFSGTNSLNPPFSLISENDKPLLAEEDPSIVSLVGGKSVRNFVAAVHNPILQDFVWLNINATPMFLEGESAPYRVFVTFNEITGQKKTLDLLKTSEERYRAIVNVQTEFVTRFLPGGTLTFVNNALCRYVGIAAEELLGRSFLEFVSKEDREELLCSLASLTPENPTMEVLERIIHPDGNLRWHHWTNTAIFDNSGNLVEYQSVGRDITEQKQAELAQQESEERYRRFIDTANEGVGITDRDYRITYANESLARMLGYEPPELIGIYVSDLLPPEEQADFLTRMEERRSGITGRRECRHLRKDGSVIWLLTSAAPILDNRGDFQGSFTMFTDLTSRMEAEIALLKAHDELEHHVEERTAALARANEQIKRMTFELIQAEEQERIRIAGELHDQVGQTLLLIKMKLDMLASEIKDEQQREAASSLSFLLECSLQDIRSLTFNMRPPLLDTASFEVALEWLCTAIKRDYGLQIDFYCSHHSFPIKIEVRYSIFQAVRELILNVVKHARTDRAELSITAEADRILIRVIDQGSGFDLDATKMQSGTNGFGLYNVQQRIEQTGGEFRITSAIGTGTSVALYIPMTED